MDILYQKYRPQKIAELDSKSVRQLLSKILVQKDLPHAFLFAGPKGIGKTSSARVLAKSLNCPKAKNGEPCSKCDICLEINRGESLDVLEIDAASNRGIDDIRQLKERVHLQPIKAKNKIYIIDEVHMLTKEAFNAILKTLEEPPPHVYFIFCTTNPEKIPDTVLSRLTRVEFRRADNEEMARALERAIKGEGIKIDKKILPMIIQAADGSFRDGHKILYQLWLEGGGKIAPKLVQEVLDRWEESDPWHLLGMIIQSDLKGAVLLLENLNERGVDWQDYGRRVLGALKEALLAKLTGIGITANFSVREISLLGDIFQQAIVLARNSPIPQLPIQLGVVDYFERQKLPIKQITATEKVENKKELPVAGSFNLTLLESKWSELLSLVKPMNHSVCALLRACRPKEVEGQYLILETFYQFHKDQLEQERNRRIVEEALAKLFGIFMRVRCQLGQKPVGSLPIKEAVVTASKTEDSKTNHGGEDLYEIAKEIFGE